MSPGAVVHLLVAVLLVAGVVTARGADAPASRADRLAAQLARERVEHELVLRELVRAKRVLRHDPGVAEALTLASVVYGVPRGQLERVAWCESGWRPLARNGRYRGIFQWGPSWSSTGFARAGLSPWSPYAAALATAQRVRVYGWGWWSCRP